MSRSDSDVIKNKVNKLYWKHHNEAKPNQATDLEETDSVHSAAERTVYEAGALEALAAEARQKLFGSFQPKEKAKKGWSKLIDGLSGMSLFFSQKTKNSKDAILARIVYHAILKQHDAIVVASRRAHSGLENVVSKVPAKQEDPPQAAKSPAAPTQEPSVAPPSQESELDMDLNTTPALSEQMVNSNVSPKKRSIKLEL